MYQRPEQAKHLREQYDQDWHRPQFHFLPPHHWMNDPNGLIQWQGRYHLFYQHNPVAPQWGLIHWGHAVSDDLVHWEDLPLALSPSPGGDDADGCWSGCAVLADGKANLFYTGIRGDFTTVSNQNVCRAVAQSDDLISWKKAPLNLGQPADLDLVGFRDPNVWQQDDTWYLLIGAGIRGVGGAALLYQSDDLENWMYLHPLLQGDAAADSPWSGALWECPQLLRFGEQYLLTVGVWDEDTTHYTLAMVGDVREMVFYPQRVTKMDYGDHHFYATQTLRESGGRAIMWGWVQESRPPDEQHNAGWSGVMSLPRRVDVDPGGQLQASPVAEIKALRSALVTYTDCAATQWLAAGHQLDIEITAQIGAGELLDLGLLQSPDGSEGAHVICEHNRVTVGSLSGTFELRPGERLALRVLVDHSVIEIFVNERCCLTTRFYTRQPQFDQVTLRCDTPDKIECVQVWEMRSIW